MWKSIAIGVVLVGVLAGCSWDRGGAAATGGGHRWGVLEGEIFTTTCRPGFLGVCPHVPYRGVIVFCSGKNVQGLCPGARVDARGYYRIRLQAGRRYLIPAPGKGNQVDVKPEWVSVVAGQTRRVNIHGGSRERKLAS